MLKSVNQRLVSSQFYIKNSSCFSLSSFSSCFEFHDSCFHLCGHRNATSCFVFRVSHLMWSSQCHFVFRDSCFEYHVSGFMLRVSCSIRNNGYIKVLMQV